MAFHISREKIHQLSNLIIEGLMEDDRIEVFVADNEIRLEIVKVLDEQVAIDEEIEEAVRKTLESYSRNIREGTFEWETLYQKHFDEENTKRRGVN